MVRPDLNRLRLGKLGSKRISLRLRAAAQLAPADLLVSVDYDCYDRGLIEMPVFKRATSITLFIDRFDISLPPAGNFDKLEHFVLRGYCSVNHSVFLSRCPRLRELEIISPVQNKECSSENCYCDQAGCWRNGQISLPNLEVVEFVIFRAADNEVDFLKFIFRSAPRLKRVTIKQCNEVSPSDRGYQEFCSILEANASIKCIWV
ncbi:uncharacterized protein LOC120696153 [Panicum virgatum]|nr:uncharacterized protein LOC120696153 [Panicum virgatum]